MRRFLLPLLAVVVLSAALPALASADTKFSYNAKDQSMTLANAEPGLANNFLIEDKAPDVRFYDPGDPKGMTEYNISFCRPGQTNSAGNVIEVFCTKSKISSILLQVEAGEDKVNFTIPDLKDNLSGGSGSDTITSLGGSDQLEGDEGADTLNSGAGNDEDDGGDGNDTITAGDGNDTIVGGLGTDKIDAGPGNDTIDVRDGIADTVTCGDGTDTVKADTVDQLDPSCEAVDRVFVAPPAGQPAADDKTPPTFQLGGFTGQKISKSHRYITVLATSSEPGIIQVGGYLAAAGVNDRMTSVTSKVGVGGGGVSFRLKLNKRQINEALKDLKHHKKPKIVVIAASEDNAGNTAKSRKLTVYLRKK